MCLQFSKGYRVPAPSTVALAVRRGAEPSAIVVVRIVIDRRIIPALTFGLGLALRETVTPDFFVIGMGILPVWGVVGDMADSASWGVASKCNGLPLANVPAGGVLERSRRWRRSGSIVGGGDGKWIHV